MRVFRDLIQFAKVYLRKFICEIVNANAQMRTINTQIGKCLFECEIAKYSSAKFFRYTVAGSGYYPPILWINALQVGILLRKRITLASLLTKMMVTSFGLAHTFA